MTLSNWLINGNNNHHPQIDNYTEVDTSRLLRQREGARPNAERQRRLPPLATIDPHGTGGQEAEQDRDAAAGHLVHRASRHYVGLQRYDRDRAQTRLPDGKIRSPTPSTLAQSKGRKGSNFAA